MAKEVACTNRLVNPLPKVGIRPAIDGRRKGVRESLENQTMAMAQSAARLISGSLRHPCGAPVECVIADSCIGGVAEAARTADKFAREGVGVSLTVSPCWCYGSETMDMDPLLPKAVWGFNGTERPGAVYLAAVLAGHTQKGLPAFGIYGRDVQDASETDIPADVREKILRFARAGLAVATLRGTSYLSLRQRLDGHRRLAGQPRFLRTLPGHARGNGGHGRVRPPRRTQGLRRSRIRPGPAVGQGQLPAKARTTTAPPVSSRRPRRNASGNGR